MTVEAVGAQSRTGAASQVTIGVSGVTEESQEAGGASIRRHPQFNGQTDAFIKLDDRAIQQLAYLKTVQSVDDKRHQKLTNILMGSVPFAFGLASATHVKKGFTQKARLEKLIEFSGTTVKWLAAFGIIDLVFKAGNKINRKSQTMGDFAENHPLMSFLGTAAASFAALALAGRGVKYVAGKHVIKIAGKYDEKLTKTLLNWGKKLDNNEILNKIASKTDKIASKMPPALNELGKGILEWSPLALGIGALIHQADHNAVKAHEFEKNYRALRNEQIALQQSLETL